MRRLPLVARIAAMGVPSAVRAAKLLVSHVGSAGARMRKDAADRTDGLPMGQQILDDAELRIDQAR